jgi:ATP-dependent Zn protease
MVWNYGMGTNGFIGDFGVIPNGGTSKGNQLSEALKEKLNAETQILLHQALKEAEDTLRTNSHILDRFAQELLKRDELDYDEIVAIFQEYGKGPRALPAGSDGSQAMLSPAPEPLPLPAKTEDKPA